MAPAEHDERHEGVTREGDVVPGGFIVRLLLAMVGISVVLCVVAWLLLLAREGQLRPGRQFPERELGAPHDVADVRATPFALPEPVPLSKERQRRALESWGWVDPQHGLVRLPVERAADIFLQREGRP